MTGRKEPPRRFRVAAVHRRMGIAAGTFGLLLGVVLYRAFALTVLEHPKMEALARAQYLRRVRLPGARGPILDRNGAELAVSVEVPSVYANPHHLRGREEEVARKLAAVLGADPYLLMERFRSKRYFVWVKRRITPEQAEQVRKLHLPGVALRKEARRFYPNGPLASQVLGFVGSEGKGLEGIELALDAWLRGSRSVVPGIRDAMGRPVFVSGLPDLGPASGHEVILTLDKSIQDVAQRALEEAVAETQAKGGTLVVLDPRTGDVLAMANAPGFDPNVPEGAKPRQWRNRAVTDAFEPGSVTKVFTLAGALETGVVRVSDQVYCERGRITVDEHVIRDSHPHEWLTVAQCIQKSSNICLYKIAQRLGKRRLYEYLRSFGFGERTGISLPGERRGRVRPWRRWSEAGLANISFGQGFTVTALQLATAVSALANGGRLPKPRIVRSVRDASGQVSVASEVRTRRVVAPWVARKVIQVMETVVQPGGTGVEAALEDWPVAGKTGTAQKVDPETGRYSNEKWVASFVGVVPADDPRLVIVVMVDEPQTAHYGGEVAAPVFRKVAAASLEILGVPRRVSGKRRTKRRPFRVPVFRTDAPPAPPLPVSVGKRVGMGVPDFTGMTIPQAIEAASKAGLSCHMVGTGLAVRQVPAPGRAPAETPCQVTFQPPD